jgi:hypothetical protein
MDASGGRESSALEPWVENAVYVNNLGDDEAGRVRCA